VSSLVPALDSCALDASGSLGFSASGLGAG
jgi:hypothetical protein